MPASLETMLGALEESQTGPSDYFGRLLHLESENLAVAGFGQSRDSDALERSNFDVIYRDLHERFSPTLFPDHPPVQIDRSSHWLVGWSETILVPALIDPEGPVTVENLHPAFVAALVWREKLDNYPVADEEDYSALEWEELSEYVEQEAKCAYDHRHPDSEEGMPEEWSQKVFEHVTDDHFSADDLPYSALESAFDFADGIDHESA